MEKVIYKITDKLNQERIDELLRIDKEEGLTAENIINIALDKKNPLHDLFEWDNSLAAYKFRLAQARIVINEVKVIIENKEYYAFENVVVNIDGTSYNSTSLESSEEKPEVTRVYKPIIEILNDKDLRNQIIKSALNNLAYWEKQNEKYNELKPIIKTADKVRKQLTKKWQKKKQ